MTPSTPQPKACRKGPAEDEGQRLVRAILKPPVRLRDVFLLHRMAGMTYSEIGLHLGMHPETVQALLAAALVRLTRAVPTSDPSLKIRRRSDAQLGESNPRERLPRRQDTPWTAMPPTKTAVRNHVGSYPIKPCQRSANLMPTRGAFTISGDEFGTETPLNIPETR